MEESINEANFSSFVTCNTKVKYAGYYLHTYSSRINSIFIAVLNSLLACSGIILNATFIVTVSKSKSLHTVSNIILFALSTNYVFTSLVAIPSQVCFEVLLSHGRLWCDLYIWSNGVSAMCVSSSFQLIIVISVERYIAVHFPFWHEGNITKMKVFTLCVVLAMINMIGILISGFIKLYQLATATVGIIFIIAHVVFFWCQTNIFSSAA